MFLLQLRRNDCFTTVNFAVPYNEATSFLNTALVVASNELNKYSGFPL